MLRKTDVTAFKTYLEDSSGLSGGYAEEIIFPETEKEAAEFFRSAADKNLKVTISGAGTGVVGGRIPFGGIILSTDNLNKILDISRFKDKPGGYAIVEPGVRIEDLKREVQKMGLAYLPDPTEKNAFIGGTIATNASGARGFKYGSTRQAVKSLRVILSGGRILKISRGMFINKRQLYISLPDNECIRCSLPDYRLPEIKNASGYFAGEGTDLLDLFIGQEGTLGLVTQVELALGELPEGSFSGMVFFNEESKALDFVAELKRCSYFSRKEGRQDGIDAACIEYFNQEALDLLREKYSQLPKQKKAAVYFDQDVKSDVELEIMEKYEKLIQTIGVNPDEIWLANSPKYKELLIGLRYDLPVLVNERVKRNEFSKIGTDIAVDNVHFPAMFNFYKRKLYEANIPSVIFGHVAENHLHVNLLPENKEDFMRAKKLYREFVVEAVRLGGTISAEHGIGKLKREYLKIMLGESGIRQMAMIKRAVDPKLILGMGNIIPEEVLRSV